ncbi:uncharacterized protein LOC106132843 isoform X2 [Amyelois transitella]|uniref:uncharacterized protein LOC106132843 isoform X2 n=1 Tax=Amyelois transitella TaxID=680683 RepID=UPI0029903004|nr:uncharacterized protein LOC106132843 isoform X2 [Amyelois transitella]
MQSAGSGQCFGGQAPSFVRWSGVTAVDAAPVFVYTASGEEDSLVGACLARCRELDDCDAVLVSQGQGNCHGITGRHGLELRQDYDVTYFKRTCLEITDACADQWWAVESTPGYSLHSDTSQRVIPNITLSQCYNAVLGHRSAQWVGPDGLLDPSAATTPGVTGTCVLNGEDKFSEPESYRVSNYYTIYIENQCRHDYQKKIDRCSYEEYNNQTLKHVDFTMKNYTKDECKTACEVEQRFVCRGFSWSEPRGREVTAGGSRGICDLHSEDLVTTGSWLLRRNAAAVYYRRVICLNITVDCEGNDMTVTYRPHGVFRGRMYVPGRGERCGARAAGRLVRLTLPLNGDCDVNFAYAITNTPAGVTNRTMAYVMVMIQNNPIIQTAGDRWVRVGCSPGPRSSTHSVDATLAVRDSGKPSLASESLPPSLASASAVFSPSSAPLTMYVVRAQDDSAAGTSAVSLGEPLELRIETTDTTEIEAYHLVASSRLGDSSVLLLDSRGCSTGQVDFPPFSRTWMAGTQRLASRFKAFRFPTSHVVRFALMVRFCENKCAPINCASQSRITRGANATSEGVAASVQAVGGEGRGGEGRGVVAQGGATECGARGGGRVPLEVEMVVGSRDILSADTLVRADHRASIPEEVTPDAALVCVHELLLVALALAWLAVQVLLLLGCCILVKRYRNLAELSLQKDYHSFDNVGFDTVSTHRRVHWPDQNIDILHTT